MKEHLVIAEAKGNPSACCIMPDKKTEDKQLDLQCDNSGKRGLVTCYLHNKWVTLFPTPRLKGGPRPQ
jgi:hypothetical protein